MLSFFMPEQDTLPGPTFEAGPGWGEKIGRWVKARWSTRVFPIIAALILLAGIAKIYSGPREENIINEEDLSAGQQTNKVSAIVEKGDGIIAVSRRALAVYLQEFPDIQLKPEERLHIDNFFKEKLRSSILSAGAEIDFLKEDFQQAINEALQLTEGQRQKLRAFLK